MKISVAVCTYNGEKYIEEQIKSIINQTIVPDEIIVVDDASSDDTVPILKKIAFQTNIEIIIEINKQTLGVTANFEKVIKKCKGDVIFLSDQDDVWFPEKIEKMIAPILKDNIDFVYCNGEITDQNLNLTGETIFSTRGKSEIWKGADRSPMDIIDSPNIKGCTMAFVSSDINKYFPIPYKKEKIKWGHDHWIAFILFATMNVVAINEPLMFYRIHENNTSGNVKKIGINKKGKKYRIKYRARQKNIFLLKYKGMNDALTKIKKEKKYRNIDLLNNFIKIIEKEKNIFERRKIIESEKHIYKRVIIIIKLLLIGDYFRFKKWFRLIVKDIIR